MMQLWLALLTLLEDFQHIADVLAQDEQVKNTKQFYYHIWAQFSQLHYQVKVARHLELHPDFLDEELSWLNSLIVPDLQSHFQRLPEVLTPYPSLDTLHHIINNEQLSQADKIQVLKDSVNFGTNGDYTDLIDSLKEANLYLKTHAYDLIAREGALSICYKRRKNPPDWISPAAKLLFQILESKNCTCNPAHGYVMQLCLETHRAKLIGCDFDLYLVLGKKWQEAQVKTATPLRPAVPSTIVDNSVSIVTKSDSRRPEKKRKVDELCADIQQMLSRLPGYRLRFRLERDSLWKLCSERSNFKIDETKPNISLAQIIVKNPSALNEKTKRILSVFLGYAVYYLHETPWLHSLWNSSNVMFIQSSNGVPLRPYIEKNLNRSPSGDLDEHAVTNELDDPDFELSPPYPCLVGLAVILMEIYKAKSFDSLARIYDISVSNETDPTALYIFAREVFQHCQFDITDKTRMAITSCLDPNIGLNDNKEKLDENELLDVIYQRIVRGLEDELEQAFSDLSVDNLDTLVQRMNLVNGGRPLSIISPLKRRQSNEVIDRRVRSFTPTDEEILNQHDSSVATSQGISNIPARNGYIAQPLVTSGQKWPVIRPNTIRVLDVPDDRSESWLATELGSLFGSECKVHSLARASMDTRWCKHATVTFPAISNQSLNDLIEKEGHHRLRGPSNLLYDTSFLGITPLYDAGEKAKIDIIAIQGLGTNPFGTFRAPHGDEMWLRDYLPEKFPFCRVLLYGYDSKVPNSKSNQSVQEIAGTCKNELLEFRELTETEDRPVIWIGQSMGGLVV